MSDAFEYVDGGDGLPAWAMVKTEFGTVPVRVASWCITADGVTPNLSPLAGTEGGEIESVTRMDRMEAWGQVAAWSKVREAAK
ncbi:hypothetical protein HY68_02295 [Streptomyces sp. AcH 505]|uniref:hypothetical protein n=1 Tax=Streptomyces sp. AcH 505 TaxID=352211 RepID=UPI000591FFC4|nr:hypothetical protein HY68_02295 [Streptomyces sp. AcH 505]